MNDFKIGINLWSQGTSWDELLDAAKAVDRLGYEHLWTWDHVKAIFGDPNQPIFEGWTDGHGVGDGHREGQGRPDGRGEHVPQPGPRGEDRDHSRSRRREGGRSSASAAPGSSWSIGSSGSNSGSSPGQRLDWLDESVGAIRALVSGQT
jgi:hypothetical protein